MKPVLDTFRRCPYAMRARLAIDVSGAEVELRGVRRRSYWLARQTDALAAVFVGDAKGFQDAVGFDY